ncbi:MAG: T9SS type A sorting domain-containing protein, partial [Bacteroidota bacterium]
GLQQAISGVPSLTNDNSDVEASVVSEAVTGLWVRPNPFKHEILAEFPASDEVLQLHLVEINGRIVKQVSIAPWQIAARFKLSSQQTGTGLLVLRLTSRDQVLTKSLIRER